MIECSPPSKLFPRIKPKTFEDPILEQNQEHGVRPGEWPGALPAVSTTFADPTDREYPKSAGRLMDSGSSTKTFKRKKAPTKPNGYSNGYSDGYKGELPSGLKYYRCEYIASQTLGPRVPKLFPKQNTGCLFLVVLPI